MKCKYHLCTKETVGKKKYCSVACKNRNSVYNWRRNLKKKAVEYLGGKCSICGYSKCMNSLVFHHEGEKDFGISAGGHTRSWNSVKIELDKCVLLCANCHGEAHSNKTAS